MQEDSFWDQSIESQETGSKKFAPEATNAFVMSQSRNTTAKSTYVSQQQVVNEEESEEEEFLVSTTPRRGSPVSQQTAASYQAANKTTVQTTTVGPAYSSNNGQPAVSRSSTSSLLDDDDDLFDFENTTVPLPVAQPLKSTAPPTDVLLSTSPVKEANTFSGNSEAKLPNSSPSQSSQPTPSSAYDEQFYGARDMHHHHPRSSFQAQESFVVDDEQDDLFSLRCAFYLGDYEKVIQNYQKNMSLDMDVLYFRSLLSLHGRTANVAWKTRFSTELNHILRSSSKPPALLALNFLALHDNVSMTELIQSNGNDGNDFYVSLFACQLLAETNKMNEAFQLCQSLCMNGHPDFTTNYPTRSIIGWMESSAMLVEFAVRMNYSVENHIDKMRLFESHPLTRISEARFSLANHYVDKAYSIYQELVEQHGATVDLLVGKAICHMLRKRFTDAEDFLLEALEIRPEDLKTQQNLKVCAIHLGKPQTLKETDAEIARNAERLAIVQQFNQQHALEG